jgi:hypothetical protein
MISSRSPTEKRFLTSISASAARSASQSQHIADVEAAPRFGMAAQVVLHFVLVVPLVETVGIAAIGQAFEFAKQGGVERTPAAASSMARR